MEIISELFVFFCFVSVFFRFSEENNFASRSRFAERPPVRHLATRRRRGVDPQTRRLRVVSAAGGRNVTGCFSLPLLRLEGLFIIKTLKARKGSVHQEKNIPSLYRRDFCLHPKTTLLINDLLIKCVVFQFCSNVTNLDE